MKCFKVFISAILAGACIAFGGTVFLSVENKVLGAVFFTVGLFCVCSFGLHLYTGKVCYIFEQDKDYALNIPIIWFGNLVGTWLVAKLVHLSRVGAVISARATELCQIKLGDELLSIFVLAIFCNIFIYIAVEGYKRIPYELGKYLALFFGVTVFILCSFEHCVANMFYFSAAGVWSLKTLGYTIVMTFGNAVGGVICPLLRNFIQNN